MSSKKRRLEKYNDIVQSICNVKNCTNLSKPEMDACLGVAIVLAFMDGIKADPIPLSEFLEVNYRSVEEVLGRLKANGIFGKKYDVRNDDVLMGRKKRIFNRFMTQEHETELAWCHIASIAQGSIGLRNKEDIARLG